MKKSPWPKMPAAFVRENLTGHKILGLAVAGILYLICLSGTATVFYTDFQRWEAGAVPDAVFTPEGVAAAIDDARGHLPKGATGVYASLPTGEMPRLTVEAGESHRGYDSAGRYVAPAATPATDGLTALHYELHVPTVGLIVVGLGGVAIIALLAGGLLAHPRIFKDAFLWRSRAGERLNRSDLHNRVGVWAAPFHLAIAVTGALIGLLQVVLMVAGLSFYHGDTARASAPVYGDTVTARALGRMDSAGMVAAFGAIQKAIPGAQPYYLSLNNTGTDHEALTVWAIVPDRLVFGEQFDFDAKGGLIARHHLNDGSAGKQAYASLYRLHFGAFGGAWVRWAFVVLGMGLTLLCSTGMDIWLLKSAQKGRPHPRLHKGWGGFIWGGAVAMAAAGLTTFAFGAPYPAVFWPVTAIATIAAVFAPSLRAVSVAGKAALGLTLLALVGVHAMRFPAALGTNLVWVSAGLLLTGLAFIALTRYPRPPVPVRPDR
ncbi:PepSY-associated TM helix domain-containing protein [Asticcacaulis solisilvae]|uniref:PepSY-associated TM helix domain-containing protein n=1 Tax=Asticcacaulis solisilvae TaxID=1217274 RepID=UPI003FD70141